MEDSTNRALITVMIIILVLILLFYFWPGGRVYTTSPASVTIQRWVPVHWSTGHTTVYTTSAPATSYHQQTYYTTTTTNTTTVPQ